MRTGTGWGTLRKVLDGSGYPRGGPGRVWGPYGRFYTGRGTIPVVQDGFGDVREKLGDPWGVP